MPVSLDSFSAQVVEIMPLMLREFARHENNPLSRGKISCPQMVALDYISHKKSTTMKDISRVLSTQMSSATVLVDRLIREKMLTRRRDGADRRQVWVAITPKGKKVVTEILRQKRISIKKVFGKLSDRERDQYLRILLKVGSTLKENHEIR